MKLHGLLNIVMNTHMDYWLVLCVLMDYWVYVCSLSFTRDSKM
jgi:hypothetical protein